MIDNTAGLVIYDLAAIQGGNTTAFREFDKVIRKKWSKNYWKAMFSTSYNVNANLYTKNMLILLKIYLIKSKKIDIN